MEYEKKLTAESVHRDRDDDTMVDVKLFKTIGLYRLLRPSAVDGSGTRYRKFVLATVQLMFAVQCMQAVRLFLVVEDLQLFPYLLMIFSGTSPCAYKAYVLMTKGDRFWAVLDAARYGFMSCGHRDPSRLRRSRRALVTWLRPFVGLVVCTMTVWLLSPWFADDRVARVKLDGTVGRYRPSTYDFWYPVPESVYNWTPVWSVVYAFESYILIANSTCFWLFDCFLITMCVALGAQFHTLSAAYETLGHRRSLGRRSSSRTTGKMINRRVISVSEAPYTRGP